MNISFDSIFCIVFGMVSLIAGIAKYKRPLWGSIKTSPPKAEAVYLINIGLGLISILIGIYLLRK